MASGFSLSILVNLKKKARRSRAVSVLSHFSPMRNFSENIYCAGFFFQLIFDFLTNCFSLNFFYHLKNNVFRSSNKEKLAHNAPPVLLIFDNLLKNRVYW